MQQNQELVTVTFDTKGMHDFFKIMCMTIGVPVGIFAMFLIGLAVFQ